MYNDREGESSLSPLRHLGKMIELSRTMRYLLSLSLITKLLKMVIRDNTLYDLTLSSSLDDVKG